MLLVLLALPLAAAGGTRAAPPGGERERPHTMGEMLDRIARKKHTDPAVAKAVGAVLAQARKVAGRAMVRRVHKFEDVGKHRTWLDGRTKYLKGKTREVFALAMSDCGTNGRMAEELPLLAAAVRLGGDATCRKRLVAQLREMATWSPLQRPGWTCYAPGKKLPAGGDGNWLATGMGVRAIGDTLEILPPDAMPADLRAALDELLATEVASIADDWRSKRPWFVRGNNPVTNQWVLPTEGLVRACLLLGRDKHRREYELGVKNLLMALSAHGREGEFEEGIGYASFTVTSLVSAARAMAIEGDRRAIDHPFLAKFPGWAVQHVQPAGMVIHCFDCGTTRAVQLRGLLTRLAVMASSGVARWAVEHCTGGPDDGLVGLFYRGLPRAKLAPPPLQAVYERAARVNWRSGWDDHATGVWVRGGHRLDQHDHNDRGHVNLIAHGRAILIEAGTPSYGHPRIHSHFTTGYGHNVLQIGLTQPRDSNLKRPQPRGWQKNRVVAPITVTRLDGRGGDVTVVADKCYDGLKRWRRQVEWDAAKLCATDDVALAAGKREVVLFRWHLGMGRQVKIAAADPQGEVVVDWPHARMTLRASADMDVTQAALPDATLKGKAAKGGDHLHTCVVVRSRGKVNTWKLTTTVTPREQSRSKSP